MLRLNKSNGGRIRRSFNQQFSGHGFRTRNGQGMRLEMTLRQSNSLFARSASGRLETQNGRQRDRNAPGWSHRAAQHEPRSEWMERKRLGRWSADRAAVVTTRERLADTKEIESSWSPEAGSHSFTSCDFPSCRRPFCPTCRRQRPSFSERPPSFPSSAFRAVRPATSPASRQS